MIRKGIERDEKRKMGDVRDGKGKEREVERKWSKEWKQRRTKLPNSQKKEDPTTFLG